MKLIPIGEFANFGECMRAQQSKGHDKPSAEKICGDMEARSKGKKKDMTEFLIKEVKLSVVGKKKRLAGILSSVSTDRGNQRISKGLIEKWAKSWDKIPLLSQHKNLWTEQVGVIFSRKALGDNEALYIEATLMDSTPVAKQFQEYLAELNDLGMGIGLSIGASVPDSAFVEKSDDTGKYTSIEDGELLEGSVVPIGMNPDAYGYMAKKFNLVEEDNQMAEETQAAPALLAPATPDYSAELKKAFEEIEALKKDATESKKVTEKAITEVVAKALETLKAEKQSVATNVEKAEEAKKMSNITLVKEVNL